jgi:predicted ATPase
MKETIHIKNLGPIKDILIADIKPFTVLIGASGSGKSLLMKTLSLFRWLYKRYNIRAYLKHSNISKSPFRFRMESYIKDSGLEQFVTGKTEVIYSRTTESGKRYEITYKNKKLSPKILDLAKGDISFDKISFIAETRSIISHWADKKINQGDLGFYFDETYEDFERALLDVPELPLEFLGIRFKVIRTSLGRKLKVLSLENQEEKFEIDFRNSSSGIQNAVPVSLIAEHFSKHFNFEKAFNRSVLSYLSEGDKLTDFRPVANVGNLEKKIYLHVEEPELSLFPDAQRDLIAVLLKKLFICTERKNHSELFLATHSPYIINYLNLLIKAHDTNKLVDGVRYNFDQLAVYQIVDGNLIDLKAVNTRLINTNRLSDPMNEIYNEYEAL